MAYQNLFETLQRVCGFIALESDMSEIINAYKRDMAAQKTQEGSNESLELDDKTIEFGKRAFRKVQMASKVELILKPEHMNTVFTWKQIQDAIMSDTTD